MIRAGGKIILKGQCLDNTGGSIVGPSLDITFKIIHGLEGMVHPGLEQAKFTGVESPIDLSLFVGLSKLTKLQFVDCPGLSCSTENFSATADLLQSGVKLEVSTGEFLARYNGYSTDNGKIRFTEIGNTEIQDPVRVEHLRQHIVSVPGDTTNQVATAFNSIDFTNSLLQVSPASRNENDHC